MSLQVKTWPSWVAVGSWRVMVMVPSSRLPHLVISLGITAQSGQSAISTGMRVVLPLTFQASGMISPGVTTLLILAPRYPLMRTPTWVST